MINKFTFCVLSILLLFGCSSHEEIKISDNGNLLFYNSPVAAFYHDKQYIAYMTNQGEIILSVLNDREVVHRIVVHSYTENVNWGVGKADDHAAPSLIVDKERERLVIATSYHGTPMYIYEYDLKSAKINLINIMDGRYTYPRLLSYEGDVYLISRLQPQGIQAGHLVLRKAKDDFNLERIIIPSIDGEVVYAGTPAVSGKGFIIAYSMHSYDENRLIGFNLVEYSLEVDAISSTCDLSYLIGDTHSNRPTGLGYNGTSIMIATAHSEIEQTYRSEEVDNFQGKNKVVVAKGESCKGFKIVEEREVAMPYYHTSIAVNDDLEYLYFDQNEYYTNAGISGCFNLNKMMYPSFADKGVIFAAMNGQYSMLDFDNSIFYCARIRD